MTLAKRKTEGPRARSAGAAGDEHRSPAGMRSSQDARPARREVPVGAAPLRHEISNELMFEDKAGHELAVLHAERDLRTVVKNNDDKVVGGHRTVNIKGNDTEHVSGNKKASVLGQEMESVGGDQISSVLGSLVSQVGMERILQTLGELASTAKAHRFSSQEGMTISVGESTIQVTPDAIIFQSPKILVNPGNEVVEQAILTGRTPPKE